MKNKLLQLVMVSNIFILAACNSGNNNNSNSSNNSNNPQATNTLATAESPGVVNGWPNYIAMGGVTNTAPGVDGLGGFSNRPVDAIFKYSGYDGAGDINQIVFPIFTMNTVNLANSISVANQHRTKPVMVNYMANMSITASLADFSQSAITDHLINLMMDAAVMEASRSESNPYPGSLVLAPDLLGMMQQNSVMPVPAGLNTAVKKAACFMSSKFQYGSFNGTPLEIGYYMRSQGMGWFDVKTYWELYAPGWLAACDTSKMNISVPTFSDSFGGWAQATGWAIRTFGPHITYGWQENIWAPGSSWWIHQANSESSVETLASNSVAVFIQKLGIYQAPYQPDFIVFDRWERDDTIGINSGYYYNDRDWENLITFSAQVGKKLGNIPVMLWQIPGGHLQVTDDVDTRSGMSSSFSDYIFGDDKLGSNLVNLRSDLVGLTLNPSIYNCGTACTSKAYLSASGYKWNQDNGKLQDLANKGIFAILWGGGSTTSVGTFPSDDGGWLAGKIRSYYQNLQVITTPVPSPTPSATPSPKPTVSPSPSPVPSPTPSVVPSPSPSPVPTVSPSPVPTQSPTPAPAKTGTVTITMPTVVSAYNGNLQVQLLNSKDSNSVVATYTVKQGASVTSGNLPISDSTHAYKVKLVSGIADPLNGINYIESGTPAVAVKNGQNTAMSIPMKASTTTKRTVTLAISGLQGSDKANISFSDANGKYSYTGYSGYGNGNAVFKIENNQNLTITVATAGGSYQSSSLSNSSTISKNQTIAMAFTAKVQPSPSPVPTVAPSPSPSPIASPTPAPSPSPSGVECSGYPVWNSSSIYTYGMLVAYNGYVYQANWWIQGVDPAMNNGATGSGQPWTIQSKCQ